MMRCCTTYQVCQMLDLVVRFHAEDAVLDVRRYIQKLFKNFVLAKLTSRRLVIVRKRLQKPLRCGKHRQIKRESFCFCLSNGMHTFHTLPQQSGDVAEGVNCTAEVPSSVNKRIRFATSKSTESNQETRYCTQISE